jgi:hypothetical protein
MNQNRLGSVILVILTVVAGLLALIIIGSICYTAVVPGVSTENRALVQLQNWGGVVIGFFFGSFFNLLAETLKSNSIPPNSK